MFEKERDSKRAMEERENILMLSIDQYLSQSVPSPPQSKEI